MKTSFNDLRDIVKDKLQLNNATFVGQMIVEDVRVAMQSKTPFLVTLEDAAKSIADAVDCTHELDHNRRMVIFRKRDACR